MKLDWTTLIIAFGAMGTAFAFLTKAFKDFRTDWRAVREKESDDKVRIAEATQFAVGTLSSFLVKVENQEKALDEFRKKVTTDNKELTEIVERNAEILHQVHEDLSEFFKAAAIKTFNRKS